MLYISEPAPAKMRRIGNKRTGIIEVPEYGFITTEEDDTISELLEDEPNAFVSAAKLAQAIAVEEGCDILEAYQVIERFIGGQPLSPEAEALKVRHAESIQGIARLWSQAGSARIKASVTSILRHRLGIEEIPANWPRVLLQGCYQLVNDEQAAENAAPDEVTSESLGKPPAEAIITIERIGSESSTT